ncbi:MAG: phosphoglycerate mutase [Pseudomonadota bacterium]
MSDKAHLLIPFAACAAPQAREALAGLQLPHLEKLLRRLSPGAPDAGDEHSFSPPHERVLARLHGLPAADGQIPWAAFERQARGLETGSHAWAVITPCHWQVGTTSASMSDPAALGISEGESQALLEAMRPYFNEDGIELLYHAPGRWHARSELFRGLPTASLERVIGRGIDDWMPKTPEARPLRRLQNEMQMLLYTHPLNDGRAARGLAPVNSFWAHGTGALPETPSLAQAPGGSAGPLIAAGLQGAALREDWPAWADAWRAIDANECARLDEHLGRTGQATLTLCGERSAQTFEAMPVSILTRLSGLFQRPSPARAMEAL